MVAAPALAEPLVREVYREVLRAGGHPLLRISLESVEELLYQEASDEQLAYVPGIALHEIEQIDALLMIAAPENTKRLAQADPRKVALRRQAQQEAPRRLFARVAAGTIGWVTTLFPTQAAAQAAEQSLDDYEDFVYRAGNLHADDPVAAWRATRATQQRLADWLNQKQVFRLVAPGTDLTFHTSGRVWINAAGEHNFPDGEIFTGPLEQKTEGCIQFSYPATHLGTEVKDIRLVFEAGRVVEATASKGEDMLRSLIDLDEGARRLGEVAFGLNHNINRFSRNILFDEKIGGTMHLALGFSIEPTGGCNRSALHWDMVCDTRKDSQVYADGQLIYKDGVFLQ
ncbi:MAG: aminopeptidase [Roseiflexaceae bacterium]